MVADFHAGSIEATLDLDTSPFRAGLAWARGEAQKFEKEGINVRLGIDRTEFDADKARVKGDLDKLDHTKAKPDVELTGVPGVLAKLKLIQHEVDKTDHKGEGGAFLGGMLLKVGLLAPAIMAALAALGPLTGAVVAFGAAAGLAFGGAAIGLGLFAASVKSAFKILTDANKAGVTLTGWAGKAQSALKSLSGAWDSLQKSVRPQMFQLMFVAFSGVAAILPRLHPLLATTTTDMIGVVNAVLALTHTGLFKDFLSELQGFMGGFLKGLAPLLVDALSTFMHLFIALRPLMSQLGHGILIAAGAVEQFSEKVDNGKIDGFIGRIEHFLPLLGSLAVNTIKAVANIGAGLAPLTGPTLHFINALMIALSKVNIKPLSKGLGDVLNTLRPMLPYLGKLVSIVADDLGKALVFIRPLLGYLVQGFIWIVSHKTLTQVLLGIGAAWWIINAAMDANPIGLVILLLAGLAAGLAYAWKHSQTFRDVVTAAFKNTSDAVHNMASDFNTAYNWIVNAGNNVKRWAEGVGSWFAGPFVHFFTGAWQQIERAWGALGDGLHSVYDHTIHPLFTGFQTAVHAVVSAFQTAVGAIRAAWDRIESVAEVPVRFVVNTVLDKGIIGSINKVAGFFHVSKVPTVHLPFSKGGSIPGHSPSDTADDVAIRATSGEFMIRRKSAQKVDSQFPGALEHINQYGTLPGYGKGRTSPGSNEKGYSVGGWIKNKVGGAVGGAFDWAKGLISKVDPASYIKGKIEGLLGQIGGGEFAQLAKGAGEHVLGGAMSWLKSKVSAMFTAMGGSGGGIGGGHVSAPGAGVARWTPEVLRALAMLHQPASLLNAVMHRMMQESGGNPNAINNWDSNAAAGDPSRGLMQTIGSTFAAYAGPFRGAGIYNPMANIYAGLNYALHRYGNIYSAMMRPGGYVFGTGSASAGIHRVGENGPELVDFRGGEKVMSHRQLQIAASDPGSLVSLLRQMVALLKSQPNREDQADLIDALNKHTAATMKAMVQVARAA
jgi:SLT domain-containing protein/phage-related protein